MKQTSDNKLLKIVQKCFQVFTTFLIVVMAFLLIVTVYGFVETKILHKDYASFFGYTYMNVISGSMADTINVDDFVFIKLGNKNINEDDIVTFKVDDTIITHRVISIVDNKVLTKGDANNDSDNLISKEDIIGEVVYIGKEFGIYLKVLKTPIVFITAFISLILFDIALFDEKSKKEVINNEKTNE